MTTWTALLVIGVGFVLGFVTAAVSSAPAIADYRTRIARLRRALTTIHDTTSSPVVSQIVRDAIVLDDEEDRRGP